MTALTEVLEVRTLLSAAPLAMPDVFSVNENQSLVSPQRITSAQMVSDPGDYVGNPYFGTGATYNITPLNGFVTPSFVSPWAISIRFAGGNDDFTAGFSSGDRNVPLAVGVYSNAVRWPSSSGIPGLDVSGDGRGSNTLTGSFTITELSFSNTGELQTFAVKFEQHSEGRAAALHGTINYNALVNVNVLSNDQDPDGDPIQAVLVSGPTHGSLTLNADGTFGYVPNTGFHGTDSFTYQANDGALNSNVATVSLAVNQVDNPPVGTSNTVSTLVDTPYPFKLSDFGFSDPNDTPANAFRAVQISSLPLAGTLTDNGVSLIAGASVPVADIAAGRFKYTPAAGGLGMNYTNWTFQVQDDGDTSLGGSDTDLTARTMTINVVNTRTAPVAIPDYYDVDQNQPLLSPAYVTRIQMTSDPGDFIGQGLSYDFQPANSTITAHTTGMNFVEVNVSSGGNLWDFEFASPYSNVALTVGTYSGAVRYPFNNPGTPGLNVDGAGRGSNILTGTFTITDISFGPSGTLNSFAATFEQHSEGGVPALRGTIEFNHQVGASVLANDQDVDGNTMNARLISLPTHGTVAFNADGSFLYTPNQNYHGPDAFTYRVNDGFLDSNDATVSLTVSGANRAPVGTSKVLQGYQNQVYTFQTADFGFTDPNDNPANQLLGVKFTVPSAYGTLLDNGVAVTPGQTVSAAEIAAGQLVFVPHVDYVGTLYVGKFQVQDDGGTVDGGVDTDTTARVFTIRYAAINHAPQGTTNTIAAESNQPVTLQMADFGFADPVDHPANTLFGVKFPLLSSYGTLMNNGVAVTAGQVVSAADIAAGKLQFVPHVDYVGTLFLAKFQVQDNGGTANGGQNLDPTAKVLYVRYQHVNHAPIGTSKTIQSTANQIYTFQTSDFGFTDPQNTPSNAFSGVKITLPTAYGSLTLQGQPITAGQIVSAADIANGRLKFTPPANFTGLLFLMKFQVQDDGGTANGGSDTDPSPKILNIQLARAN